MATILFLPSNVHHSLGHPSSWLGWHQGPSMATQLWQHLDLHNMQTTTMATFTTYYTHITASLAPTIPQPLSNTMIFCSVCSQTATTISIHIQCSWSIATWTWIHLESNIATHRDSATSILHTSQSEITSEQMPIPQWLSDTLLSHYIFQTAPTTTYKPNGTSHQNPNLHPMELCAFCACWQQQQPNHRPLTFSALSLQQWPTHASVHDTNAFSIYHHRWQPRNGSNNDNGKTTTINPQSLALFSSTTQQWNPQANYYACLIDNENDDEQDGNS